MAPVERGPHRLLAIGPGAPAVGEEVELRSEAGGHLLRAEGAEPCGRQLEGERQACQLRADPGHRCCIAVGEPEARSHVGAPLDQEADGVVLGQALERLLRIRIGPGERRDRPLDLARQAQRLPAGRQHAQLSARRQQLTREGGHPGADVLAVVEHKKEVTVCQRGAQELAR